MTGEMTMIDGICCAEHLGNHYCDRFGGPAMMILCKVCGNKRCPKATDCALTCTNSNESGQPGSNYQRVRQAYTPDYGQARMLTQLYMLGTYDVDDLIKGLEKCGAPIPHFLRSISGTGHLTTESFVKCVCDTVDGRVE